MDFFFVQGSTCMSYHYADALLSERLCHQSLVGISPRSVPKSIQTLVCASDSCRGALEGLTPNPNLVSILFANIKDPVSVGGGGGSL